MNAEEQNPTNRNHCPNLLADRSVLEENLLNLQSEDDHIARSAIDPYCRALDTYLELPSLLEPIVSTHINTLCNLVCSRLSTDAPIAASAFQVALPSRALYTLIKVRGPKRITAHFPHQVHHLRQLFPVLSEVESLDRLHQLWHLRYVLYTWLSVAIRVPFPLNTILTPQLLQKSVNYAQAALSDSGPVAQAATAFLARFLSRRDTAEHRVVLIENIISNSLTPKADQPIRAAALALLASVYKHAHRDDLKPYVHRILQCLPHPNATSTTTETHLVTKLSHRLALAFLPPRPASWRYMRCLPVIRRAEGHVGPVEPESQTTLTPADSNALEIVLDLLLVGLCQRDTVVRWSAAKGIARITTRLPQELAMDVIDAVLAIFDDVQQARSDAAWHGACLAIAELARRGLLLPSDQHFRDAFSAIHRAAVFDVRRGANSVGAQVRDAACYAVWAVARAYGKEDVASFAPVISKAMLPLALLDREINCRRAAAAALQECVGRLSADLFVDGIKLITLADYFSLGDRNTAYLTIAPQVAQIGDGVHFDEIVKELWNRKLMHWDPAIRALAAKALARLVAVDKRGVVAREVLPELVLVATRRGDMVCRHGAVLGIAELVNAIGYEGVQSVGKEIQHIPALLHKDSLLTGKTGDDMRIACCHLILSIAMKAKELFQSDYCGRTAAEEALKFLETVLGCGKEQMYAPATSAYRAVCNNVIANNDHWHVEITQRILHGISGSPFPEQQRGFALAAGACGDSEMSNQIVDVLCGESKASKDVEVRRNCVTSLGSLPTRVLRERITDVLHGFSRAMEDYATDERGDVGSWVREASMNAAARVVRSVYKAETAASVISLNMKEEAAIMLALNRMVEQCCSKIDRTREVAGQALKGVCLTLHSSVRSRSRTPSVTERLCQTFGFSRSINTGSGGTPLTSVTFADSAEAFCAMANALYIPEVSTSAIRGFISAGGGMGQQGRLACRALATFLGEKKNLSVGKAELGEIASIIRAQEERLLVPALNTLDHLLKQGVLRKLKEEDFKELVLAVRNSWRHRVRNVKLIYASIRVLSEIASLSGSVFTFQFEADSAGRNCLEALAIVLGGPLPRLRRIAAENLYMILLEVNLDEGSAAKSEGSGNILARIRAALDILADKNWEKMTILKTRLARNEFCKVLGIRTPTAVAAKGVTPIR